MLPKVSYTALDEGPLPDKGVLSDYQARPMYHKWKGLAQNEADRIKVVYQDRIKHTKVEFEPNNGWVVVLFSDTPHDLDELSDRFEIRDGVKRPKPDYRVKVAPVEAPKPAKKAASDGPGGPPVKGATAKVWVIADAYYAGLPANHVLNRTDRGAIIAKCEAEGINPATAATQFSKWKRSKGL